MGRYGEILRGMGTCCTRRCCVGAAAAVAVAAVAVAVAAEAEEGALGASWEI